MINGTQSDLPDIERKVAVVLLPIAKAIEVSARTQRALRKLVDSMQIDNSVTQVEIELAARLSPAILITAAVDCLIADCQKQLPEQQIQEWLWSSRNA